LSLQARQDVECERGQHGRHGQQQVPRARDEVDLAERRDPAVDPANRVVAATLEQWWEEALRHARPCQEAYARVLQDTPPHIQAAEWARITAVASEIPALWPATGTTNRDRQAIIRCLVDHVVVHVQRDSESGPRTSPGAGGSLSQHEVIRPVRTYAQLRDVETLMRRIRAWRTEGATTVPMATGLNRDGVVPPQRDRPFSTALVGPRLDRQGLGDERRVPAMLGPDEWWLSALARTVQRPATTLREWVVRGWLHARQSPAQGVGMVWADAEEMARVGHLLAQSRRGMNADPASFTTPKPRPTEVASGRR
jgi:hypothetical protein